MAKTTTSNKETITLKQVRARLAPSIGRLSRMREIAAVIEEELDNLEADVVNKYCSLYSRLADEEDRAYLETYVRVHAGLEP